MEVLVERSDSLRQVREIYRSRSEGGRGHGRRDVDGLKGGGGRVGSGWEGKVVEEDLGGLVGSKGSEREVLVVIKARPGLYFPPL